MDQTITKLKLLQPTEAFYPVQELEESIRYTRASFVTQFGVQPDAYDPSKQIKRWAQTELAGAGTVSPGGPVHGFKFNFIDRGQVREMELSGAWAASLNLPGLYSFPKYVPEGTTAMMTGPFGFQGSVPAITLSTWLQATALAGALNKGAVMGRIMGYLAEAFEQELDPAFSISWGSEKRRQMAIRVRLEDSSVITFTVGILLAQRHAAGTGAPGSWSIMPKSYAPLWTSATQETGEFDSRPEIPMPIRALLPNEKLVEAKLSPFSAGQMIVVNMEKESVYNPKPSGSGSGGRTERLAELILIALGGDPSKVG